MVGVSSRKSVESCYRIKYSNAGFFIHIGSDLFYEKILSVSGGKF